ncbi:hypothetical protein HN385_06755 [archaeon]|nr:hypothetical protein [archaeon]MBT3450704.1 hypothetical protein [archaeon]MBT6869196.1 hypothetical protein [archaeon]MBT7193732.1 hypothetical protein [archaeon]MBT7381379.1 hypothetical protein [archaeon]
MTNKSNNYLEAVYYSKSYYGGGSGKYDDEEEGVLIKNYNLLLMSLTDGRSKITERHLLSGDLVNGELSFMLGESNSMTSRYYDSETRYNSIKKIELPKQIENYDLTDKINYHTLQEKKINLGDFVEDIIKIARELD